MLTKEQKKILQFLQKDLPLENSPYLRLAKQLGVDEERIIDEIKKLKKANYISRFGAILDHYRIGLTQNCMCVFNVTKKNLNRLAEKAVRQPQISHCYLRKTSKNWPYNFFTMIHGKKKADCLKVVKELVSRSGVSDYKTFFTLKQFKKTSPEYKI